MLISSNLQAVEPLPETLNALQTTLDRVSSAGRRSDLPLEVLLRAQRLHATVVHAQAL